MHRIKVIGGDSEITSAQQGRCHEEEDIMRDTVI